jgi:dephospho-CoA kinase
MVIVGITGTLGAGKGTVVDFLVKEKGFKHFSVRSYLSDKILDEHGEINRDTLVEMGNRLRKDKGLNFLAEELFKEAQKSNINCVIESLRTPSEIESLRAKGKFYLFAIDADPWLRYLRIRERNGVTDKISFEEFLRNEKREMDSDDPTKQNLRKCIQIADFYIENDFELSNLYEEVENAMSKIEGGFDIERK